MTAAVRFAHSPEIELQDLPASQQEIAGPSNDDGDIYRGKPSHPKDDTSSISTRSSGSSSSSSGMLGGRLGVIAAVVELAVSRWARGVRRGGASSSISTTSSSSSSSSSSSGASINTLARARRRRRRNASQSSLVTIQSELDIVARISRLKALEESRQVARQFALYLPSTAPQPGRDLVVVPEDDASRRVLSTTSLSLLLRQLEVVTKKPRNRRPRGRSRGPNLDLLHPSLSRRSYQLNPDSLSVPGRHRSSSFDVSKKSKKGKSREVPSSSKNIDPRPASTPRLMPKAWFLDVASPTWEDLRALGKLLHLHPLTLEDILQKDPREKLEVFPKLGYYFVSFRAIESQAERAKILRELHTNADHDSESAEIPIGEANVYLAVFNEGICCFHYRDISEHVDRVRHRIALLDDVANMSSDWIAHGILDSVVDAFFPVLNEIEKEVTSIDRLVYEQEEDNLSPNPINDQEHSSAASSTVGPESGAVSQKSSSAEEHPSEKRKSTDTNATDESIRPHFVPPRPTFRLMFRHARRYFTRIWERGWVRKADNRANPRTLTLRRMAKTRKLVTLLGRLLASKADVVTQIRKRLLQSGKFLGNGSTKGEELEVAIHMGDVQDHILTLQHSLSHIERMLSQSHPSYLANLRSTVARTKGDTDKGLVYLTTLSIAVLCCQTIIGIFSTNVTVPRNETSFILFGVVILIECIVLSTYSTVVNHWWRSSKRLRGVEWKNTVVPDVTPES